MSTKTLRLADKYDVTIYKRKGLKSVRLSVSPLTGVRLSMPYWVSYKYGENFLYRQLDFIKIHYPNRRYIVDHQQIGKFHKIRFIQSDHLSTVKSKIINNEIIINLPLDCDLTEDKVQSIAKKYSIRALRDEAEIYLPKKLNNLSQTLNLPYKTVTIRQLKTRWGSCDSNKNISLNLFLMTLPDNLIDYVLIHELSHTKILKHNSSFWSFVEQILPDYKHLKKEIKNFQPVLD